MHNHDHRQWSAEEREAAARDIETALAILERCLPESQERRHVLRNSREAINVLRNVNTKVCIDCEIEFYVDAQHFLAKGLTIPKRCIDCRRAKSAYRQSVTG